MVTVVDLGALDASRAHLGASGCGSAYCRIRQKSRCPIWGDGIFLYGTYGIIEPLTEHNLLTIRTDPDAYARQATPFRMTTKRNPVILTEGKDLYVSLANSLGRESLRIAYFHPSTFRDNPKFSPPNRLTKRAGQIKI